MTAVIDADETAPTPGEPVGDTEAETPPDHRSRGSLVRALALMAVVGAALAALIVVVVDRSDTPTVDPYEVTVAAGTATGLTSGDTEDLVPATIRLEPGQQLVLRNNDFQPHSLGDLTAERGDTVRMSYPNEGRNVTATTLRRDGRLTILVEAPS